MPILQFFSHVNQGTVIKKTALSGRGTYYCPACQKFKPCLAAVSGNIGSGKSTVCEMIREKGYTVLSCDAINAELLKEEKTIQVLSQMILCQKEAFSKDLVFFIRTGEGWLHYSGNIPLRHWGFSFRPSQ